MQRILLTGLTTLLFCGLTHIASGQPGERIAPLLDGMGDHQHPITTDVAEAQRFFDQGLVLAYGFNHAEAARSFREAARLDPECAMCYWGEALVLGPNINARMDEADVPVAYAALQKAKALASDASERERAYIDALAARYTADPPQDRSALDQAYAEGMGALARRYPDDLDAAALHAEALMDTMPWDYWTDDGAPKAATETVLATLERVLERNPDHPLALHLYIHAVEKERPERGVAAADRLGDLVPGAGHLVHMPGHIYIRVGRYHDAVVANEKAIAADDAYVTQCHAQGLYPIGYMPHNHHFLWSAATFDGRGERAIEAARHVSMHQDQTLMRTPGYGTLQHYGITPLYALARFGRWDELLAEPEPAEDLLYPRGVWHYARGLALVRTGRLAQAGEALQQLSSLRADPALDAITIWDLNTSRQLLVIAEHVLAGELAAARGDYEEAVRQLEAGVAREDALSYDEPPSWHHPVRHVLGAVLLEAGRAAEAERVYRDDLAKYPANGWSLFGLAASLEAQGRSVEAEAARTQYDAAWPRADVTLTASRF